MTSYDDEQKGMDIALDDLHAGSVLQTLGWVLLVFDGIPIVWVWIGFRSGSYFWLYWVLAEGVLGCALSIAGTMLRSKAARDFARLGTTIVAPSMHEAERAQREERPKDEAA